ncbi:MULTISPECIES: hypothetical protein [Halorubrum]|uniref:hypothetical protein n=1 Tax=Halorubrum TaxID=56688 RepID=UPI0015D4C290|nr:hypothetical protein [Halorubrum persicum]
MANSDASIGLVACEECGALRSVRRPGDAQVQAADDCQECGNDSFTDIRNPSEM